jgi:arylsulfatase A-like enzyme
MSLWKPATAAVVAVAAALLVRGDPARLTAAPPDPLHTPYNVVLVSLDTLRADRLGCYGYDARPTTPVIDALAEESVLFENAITASPWTTPAHLSLLTSLYPSSHGVTESFEEWWGEPQPAVQTHYRIPDSRVTLAEVLAEGGFTTAAFTGGGPMDPAFGFGQGFGSYGTSMFKLTEQNVGEILGWLAANADRQFFLFWHHYEVHAPYLDPDFVDEVVAPGHAQAIVEGTRELARTSPDSVWLSHYERIRTRQKRLLRDNGAFERDVCEALYAGGVRAADRWLGRVIDALRRDGVYDRTILVVTSDHGEEFADRRRRRWYDRHGHSLYEELVHVPLLIKLPGGYAGGTRVQTVVETVDVMPTILAVLRITLTKNEMQGHSLAPLWNPTADHREEGIAFSEALNRRSEKKCVRTGRYKYIVNVDEATTTALGRKNLPPDPLPAELYDLLRDPLEHRNLLKSDPTPEARSIAADLERRLRQHLAEQHGKAETAPLRPTTVTALQRLGYIGNDAGNPEAGQ